MSAAVEKLSEATEGACTWSVSQDASLRAAKLVVARMRRGCVDDSGEPNGLSSHPQDANG